MSVKLKINESVSDDVRVEKIKQLADVFRMLALSCEGAESDLEKEATKLRSYGPIAAKDVAKARKVIDSKFKEIQKELKDAEKFYKSFAQSYM